MNRHAVAGTRHDFGGHQASGAAANDGDLARVLG
jgi:hypothetical protein